LLTQHVNDQTAAVCGANHYVSVIIAGVCVLSDGLDKVRASSTSRNGTAGAEMSASSQQAKPCIGHITHLTFDDSFHQEIAAVNSILATVTHLTLPNRFNQPLAAGLLPESVTRLTFGWFFNQPLVVGTLPSSLTHLTFVTASTSPSLLAVFIHLLRICIRDTLDIY
jgi:hypothetical protein